MPSPTAYQPVPVHDEDQNDVGAPATLAGTATLATSNPRPTSPAASDGVFSHLAATKPAGPAPPAPAELPPSYDVATADPVPEYPVVVVSDAMTDSRLGGSVADRPLFFDADVLVEGLPVGSMTTLVCSALVSMMFQLVGVFLTCMLSTTHAGRYGAQIGFGFTLIQFGLTLRSQPWDAPPMTDDPYGDIDDPDLSSPLPTRTPDWAPGLLMMLGTLQAALATARYVYVRRVQALVRRAELYWMV
ncbi:hypothetical protein AMAG_12547 [Allomyces macrogynus ATCC 38327]|uniref:Uncharacterized protein n=1 Tax=Allomyces macrogynus (strain ATCC 38327) TaxID=578462 RepID=A0A0L0SZJ3_ALLM3|nr:hypothetical protein AMAG_12547 [Allomyces macrogynus ATCC 38327]|eukprot:KNE67830.1 hypothetical protein AMAG_12547 [Allomyces macrogynus ATCC 38327]